MIFRRVTRALVTCFGRRSFSWQRPSMRYRTSSSFSSGSMWMSEAPRDVGVLDDPVGELDDRGGVLALEFLGLHLAALSAE